jgi:hypothetical protein
MVYYANLAISARAIFSPEARVRNSYRSMRTAAMSASDRITRPMATNFNAQEPSSFAGQFTDNSTVRPRGSCSSVVNSTPPLPIFKVFPVPLTWDNLCMTRYRNSSQTGNRVVRLRLAAPPCVTSASNLLSPITLFIVLAPGASFNRPKASLA